MILMDLNCNSNPVEPYNLDVEIMFGLWILHIQILIKRIWASSPTDVWGTNTDDWDKSISHFDGQSWSSYGVYRN